jgi:intracellular multiplication protein IcmK
VKKMFLMALVMTCSAASFADQSGGNYANPNQSGGSAVPPNGYQRTQSVQAAQQGGYGSTTYGAGPGQQQGQFRGRRGQQGQNPEQSDDSIVDDSLDDVSPPIPVTRQVVQRLVGNSNAQVLDPQEIESVRTTTSRARRAAVSPYPGNVTPIPVHRSVIYVPDTRTDPETIRLWQGTVTAIVFTDMAGNAWNLESVAINCLMFDDGRSCSSGQGGQGMQSLPAVAVQGVATAAGQPEAQASGPSAPTNVLNLQSLQQYAYGNVVVRLQGMSSPIVMVLKTGLDGSNRNDMQVDYRVQGRNPSARPEMMTLQTLPGFDPHMSDFLYGVPPTGAKQMKVSGGVAQAWLFDDALYVRTNVAILSPAFTDHVGSAEGIEVYKYSYAVPTLLASINGSPVTFVVTGN